MERQSIRRGSEKAVARFLEITGARPSEDRRRGDAILSVEGKDHYVEIKQCRAEWYETNTVNQIRPIQFIPLVVYNPERATWYVSSATRIVRLASKKQRGQHTEIPYECINLSLSKLESDACDEKDLRSRVEAACLEAEAHSELRIVLQDLLRELQEVRDRYHPLIRGVLGDE